MTRPNPIPPRLFAALAAAPAPWGLTQAQMADSLQTSQATICRNLRAIRGEGGTGGIYICRWQVARTNEGPPVAAYTLGTLPDVECALRKLSQAERDRRRPSRVKLPQTDLLTQCFFGRL